MRVHPSGMQERSKPLALFNHLAGGAASFQRGSESGQSPVECAFDATRDGEEDAAGKEEERADHEAEGAEEEEKGRGERFSRAAHLARASDAARFGVLPHVAR